jgi:hypothetical protein
MQNSRGRAHAHKARIHTHECTQLRRTPGARTTELGREQILVRVHEREDAVRARARDEVAHYANVRLVHDACERCA